MLKKLLFQFDSDRHPSTFDTVVAYDAGADHVIGYGDLTVEAVRPLVEGAIFTRPQKHKQRTAIFIGGSDVETGQQLLEAVKNTFFAGFRVSVMLDSNGCNTTAVAAVIRITTSTEVRGKKAVILAGTGPVGQRAAYLLAREGARVVITSRSFEHAAQACDAIQARFGVEVTPLEAADQEARGQAIVDAQIVFAAGAAGIQLLDERHWAGLPRLEVLADANASPPLGIEGVEMTDRGSLRHGKICWGALGFGDLKLKLQRDCIAKLFERNDQVLDAESIYALAKEFAGN